MSPPTASTESQQSVLHLKTGGGVAKKTRTKPLSGLPKEVVRELVQAKLEVNLAKAELALAENQYAWALEDWDLKETNNQPPSEVELTQAAFDAAQITLEEKEAALKATQQNKPRLCGRTRR